MQMRQEFNHWMEDVCDLLLAHSETACVVGPNNSIVSFPDPDCAANQALFSLLEVYCDNHFHVTLNNTPHKGDQALLGLQTECASTDKTDQHYFTRQLVSIEMKSNESARSYITRFSKAVTEAKEAQVFYPNDYLVDAFLAGLENSSSIAYQNKRTAFSELLLHDRTDINLATLQVPSLNWKNLQ